MIRQVILYFRYFKEMKSMRKIKLLTFVSLVTLLIYGFSIFLKASRTTNLQSNDFVLILN